MKGTINPNDPTDTARALAPRNAATAYTRMLASEMARAAGGNTNLAAPSLQAVYATTAALMVRNADTENTDAKDIMTIWRDGE